MLTNGIGILALAGSVIGAGIIAGNGAQATKTAPATDIAPAAVLIGSGQESKTISLSLTNAKVEDVLNELKKHGINFAASPTTVSNSTRVTLHVTGRPVSEVMDALGAALGGRWIKRGETYAFTKGGAFEVIAPGNPGDYKFRDFNWSPEAEAEMKRFADEMRKSAESFKLDEKSAKEFEQLSKELSEKLKKELKDKKWEFKFDGKEVIVPELKGLEGGRVRVFTGDQLKELEELKDLDRLKALKDLPKYADSKVFRMNSRMDAQKFIESLSKDQKEKMAKDGHLQAKDLSAAQLKMLGDLPTSGNWSISLSVNGQSVTIKGNDK